MASSSKIPENVLKEIEEGSAGSKEYEAQKKRNLKHFKKFLVDVENVNDELEELMKYPDSFETYIKNYFMGIRVPENAKDIKTGKLAKTGEMVLPTMGYARNIKASLFRLFTKEYKLNLTDPLLFPKHDEWWGKYMKYLKKEGKGTVTHKPRLHNRFNEKAMILAYHCLKALQNRDNPEVLRRHQKEIPPSWMNKPHVILQDYCILQVIQFGVRRAKEGIADLRVGCFQVIEDEVWGHRAWVKQTTEFSKNHPDDEENVANSGQIPYLDMLTISDQDSVLTFNPGVFFEEVRRFYSPAAKVGDRMFMKPITSCKFDVWDVNNTVLFHSNSPLGKNTIGDIVSLFCKILGLDHRTNHSVRADCVQSLISLGYSLEQISKLTGHKDPRSLLSYDPALDPLHKLDMMAGIMQGGAGQRGEVVMLPSAELMKRNQAKTTTSTFNTPSIMLDGPVAKKRRPTGDNGIGDELECLAFPTEDDSFFPESSVPGDATNPVLSSPKDVESNFSVLPPHSSSALSPPGAGVSALSPHGARVSALSPPDAGVTALPPPGARVSALPPSGVEAVLRLPKPMVEGGHHNSDGMAFQAPSHMQPPSFQSPSHLQPPSFQALPHLQPPSRDEFNNHRLNILEVSFLQSQRTSLLESKVNQQCNFHLDLPSLSEYEKLPLEKVTRAAQVSSTYNKQSPHRSFLIHQMQPAKDEEVCHCGLIPVLHTIQATGADFGRQFFSCIQKEDQQCSYFKWKKVIPKKPKVIDLFCDCGLVSDVRTVSKNGHNYGREYYACSKSGVERCSFFWFVDPALHYQDSHENSTKKPNVVGP